MSIGASPGELHKLLQERLKAMETMDTEVRLVNVTKYAEQSRASLAAKVALQSLQFWQLSPQSLYTILLTTTELKGDLTIAHPSAKHEINFCLLSTVIVWPSMRVVSREQNILVFSYLLIRGLLVQREWQKISSHSCLMIMYRIFTGVWRLLREIVARFPQAACRVKVLHFPEMPGFLSKQAGLVVDYF